ncbi:MAG: hypothetical protein AB2A00_03275 [Myxococcota bacterium]
MASTRFQRSENEVTPPIPDDNALQELLALRMMGACWHPFTDVKGARKMTLGEMLNAKDVQPPLTGTICSVRVMPSFHAWADLGVVTARRGDQVAFHRVGIVVGGEPAANARADLVELELPALDLPPLLPAPNDEGSMLDGCRYCATFMSAGANITVRFSPVSARYRAWARSFHELAHALARVARNPVLDEYLDVWATYLPSDPGRG